MAPPRLWSDLPDDVLKTLAAHLFPNFFDVLSFEAVCKSWRAAAAAVRSPEEKIPRRPSLPCITFRAAQPEPSAGEGRGEKKAATTSAATTTATIRRCFHSLANDRVYCREVSDESPNWDCWGSSHGWLLMMDRCGDIFFFNPFTGARVGLPPLTTLPVVVRIGRRKRDGAPMYVAFPMRGAVMGRIKEGLRRFTADGLRVNFVGRLALSSPPSDPGSVAVVMERNFCTLAYARPGDESWTKLEALWDRDAFQDVVYNDKEGRFYALSCNSGVFAIDFPSTSMAEGRLLQPTVKLVAPTKPNHGIGSKDYLVVLPSGEILQVCRFATPIDDDDDEEEEEGEEEEDEEAEEVEVEERDEDGPEHGDSEDDNRSGGDDDSSDYELGNEDHEYSSESEHGYVCRNFRTVRFEMFLLSAGDEGNKTTMKHWVYVHSICECALFLGLNQTISLPASGEAVGKYRPNCIYFTDDLNGKYSRRPYRGPYDCGVFEFGKWTLEFFFSPNAAQMVTLPMWIIPNK